MQQYLSYLLAQKKQEQQLICQTHNRKIEYINTDQKYKYNPNLFQCPQCFREIKDQQKFISISEILYTNKDTNLNLLNAMVNTEETDNIKEKITNCKVILEELHKKMIGGLEEMQKLINEQINKAKDQFSGFYNQAFSSISFIENSLQQINHLYNSDSFRSQVKSIIQNEKYSTIDQKSSQLKKHFAQLESQFGQILQQAQQKLPQLLIFMEKINKEYEDRFLETKCNLVAVIGMNKVIEAVQFPNEFRKSKSGESISLKQRKNIFTNKCKLQQEIISKLSFSDGIHQVILQVLAKPNEGTIYIGLVNNLSKHEVCYFDLNNNYLSKESYVQMIVNFNYNSVIFNYYQSFQQKVINHLFYNDVLGEDYSNLRFSIIWDNQDIEVPIAIIYCD